MDDDLLEPSESSTEKSLFLVAVTSFVLEKLPSIKLLACGRNGDCGTFATLFAAPGQAQDESQTTEVAFEVQSEVGRVRARREISGCSALRRRDQGGRIAKGSEYWQAMLVVSFALAAHQVFVVNVFSLATDLLHPTRSVEICGALNS